MGLDFNAKNWEEIEAAEEKKAETKVEATVEDKDNCACEGCNGCCEK